MSLSTFKWWAIYCFVVAMVILLGGGYFMKKDLPPYPGEVADQAGLLFFERSAIIEGQDIFQRYGLRDQGVLWGHYGFNVDHAIIV